MLNRLRARLDKSWRETQILWKARRNRISRHMTLTNRGLRLKTRTRVALRSFKRSTRNSAIIPDAKLAIQGIITITLVVFLAAKASGPSSSVWAWLMTLPWLTIGKWALGIVAGLVLVQGGYKLWKKRRPGTGAAKPSRSVDVLLMTLGWGIVVAATVLFLVWNGKRSDREEAEEKRVRAIALATYAKMLDSALILPSCDTAFVIMVGSEPSRIFLPNTLGNPYLGWKRPANSHSAYAVWTKKDGWVEFWPGDPPEKIVDVSGGVRFRALGASAAIYVHQESTGRKCSARPTQKPIATTTVAIGSFLSKT
ncbi:hypothetical protein KW796_00340 [Candidatus Parcubacteria bacterium]|nr:hypothetical protein [Candidatus Parcubacteria bacterium]